MWTRDFKLVGNYVVMMLVQFFALLGCMVYINFVYLTNIRPDQLAKESFVASECFVMSKKLSSQGGLFRRYRSDFLISYQADGVQYHHWVSGNGLDRSYMHSAASQRKLLSAFADGKNYVCWVSPDDPEIVLLVQRESWSSIYPMLAPVLIGCIILFFFLKNVLMVWREMKNKVKG
tara:strand:+ start:193 stop:720 length:528 start_codon:yes stop_codon:yes gene_type:complete